MAHQAGAQGVDLRDAGVLFLRPLSRVSSISRSFVSRSSRSAASMRMDTGDGFFALALALPLAEAGDADLVGAVLGDLREDDAALAVGAEREDGLVASFRLTRAWSCRCLVECKM